MPLEQIIEKVRQDFKRNLIMRGYQPGVRYWGTLYLQQVTYQEIILAKMRAEYAS